MFSQVIALLEKSFIYIYITIKLICIYYIYIFCMSLFVNTPDSDKLISSLEVRSVHELCSD